jgi:hypothetical protein
MNRSIERQTVLANAEFVFWCSAFTDLSSNDPIAPERELKPSMVM